MSQILILDFETTSAEPDCQIIEAGWCRLDLDTNTINDPKSMLIKPTVPITIGAMSIHHLRDSDVAHGRSLEEMEAILTGDVPLAYCAHNYKFEAGLFKAPAPWICTMKCAMKLLPQAGKYTNQFLRYFLDVPLDDSLAMPPHRAGPDAYVTAYILRELLTKATVNELIQITSEKILLSTVPFGKHRGLSWSKMDAGYLRWVLQQSFDENVMYTAQRELERRGAK